MKTPGTDKKTKIGIIGVENVFMGDDGAGDCLLKFLGNESLPENVAIINEGTRGMSLLHILAKLDTAIIIDAVDFGGSPGEICCFTPEEVKSEKHKSGLSGHECDLLDVIELSRKLGECPEKIIIFGIQPSSVASGELSSAVKEKLPELSEHILELVRSNECTIKRSFFYINDSNIEDAQRISAALNGIKAWIDRKQTKRLCRFYCIIKYSEIKSFE